MNFPTYKLLGADSGLYVKHRRHFFNPCYVVAGGNSLKGFDFSLLENKITFVSNKSIFDVPNPNYFITTDYTFFNHLKKENLYEKWKRINAIKFFVANCISDQIQIVDDMITDVKFNLIYDLSDVNKIIICKSAKDIGYSFNNFNSGYNSGFSSFQLALLMGYNPIYLLGMDMNTDDGRTHYHGGYNRSVEKMEQNLNNYCSHFMFVLDKLKIERPELKVISCSPISKLNDVIPYQPIEEVI
jgi:hypothetical protein